MIIEVIAGRNTTKTNMGFTVAYLNVSLARQAELRDASGLIRVQDWTAGHLAVEFPMPDRNQANHVEFLTRLHVNGFIPIAGVLDEWIP